MAKTYIIGKPDATATLDIRNAAGDPASVDGIPVWASSDETVVRVTPAADGMTAAITPVAPNPVDQPSGAAVPARITVTADADLGQGVKPLVGVSEDILVIEDPNQASVINITLGDQPAA